MFTVDQAYRINKNRALLVRPIAALAGGAPVSSEDGVEVLQISCECSADHCTGTLVVRRDDYEWLKPERRQLLVAAGHETDTPVQVMLRTETYEIVEPWGPW